MSITTEAIARFDEQIIDTFFNCIMKISDNLNKRYDPDSPESNALFRLFCTATKMQLKTIKPVSMISPPVKPIHQVYQPKKRTIVGGNSDVYSIKNNSSTINRLKHSTIHAQ